jgi:predicted transcriptional regulator
VKHGAAEWQNVGPTLNDRRKIENMSKPKEEVRRLLEAIPEDATYEDIQYHIYVRQAIENGLAAVERGEVLSHEEVERRMAKWLGE